MSMWRKMRIENKITISQIAKENGKTRQFISQCELGQKKMPKDLQIYYLTKFRRNYIDDIIVNFLKEEY